MGRFDGGVHREQIGLRGDLVDEFRGLRQLVNSTIHRINHLVGVVDFLSPVPGGLEQTAHRRFVCIDHFLNAFDGSRHLLDGTRELGYGGGLVSHGLIEIGDYPIDAGNRLGGLADQVIQPADLVLHGFQAGRDLP